MYKLCLTIHSLQPGGMERVMSHLANYFSAKDNVEVHLVMYGIKPIMFYSLASNIIVHRAPFVFNNKLRFLYTIKTLLFLRHVITQIRPYSVLSFGERFNNLVLLALLGKKVNVFVSDRCQPNKSLGWFQDVLRWFLYQRVSGVIVQTNLAKEIYQKSMPKARLNVIGNPIKTITSESEIIRENIVLTVGRLIESKHHDELIRIFADINMPDWKLVIVGDDALKQNNKQKLEHLIKQLNFEDRITLAGAQNNVDEYYLRSKIFVLTSSSEGFPNVIGEAMAAGLPVVAFDCIAGPSDMITDNIDGFLIPLFDYGLLKEKLIQLMNDQKLREVSGDNAKADIRRFASDIIGEAYYSLLTFAD